MSECSGENGVTRSSMSFRSLLTSQINYPYYSPFDEIHIQNSPRYIMPGNPLSDQCAPAEMLQPLPSPLVICYESVFLPRIRIQFINETLYILTQKREIVFQNVDYFESFSLKVLILDKLACSLGYLK